MVECYVTYSVKVHMVRVHQNCLKKVSKTVRYSKWIKQQSILEDLFWRLINIVSDIYFEIINFIGHTRSRG